MRERPFLVAMAIALLLTAGCTASAEGVAESSSTSLLPQPSTTLAPAAITASTLPSTSTSSSIPPTTTTLGPLGESGVVKGVVIAVDGSLAGVTSFTLRLADGTDATFVPQPGVLFDGNAPMSHIRDHLASGAPVQVTYAAGDDGTISAIEVGDA